MKILNKKIIIITLIFISFLVSYTIYGKDISINERSSVIAQNTEDMGGNIANEEKKDLTDTNKETDVNKDIVPEEKKTELLKDTNKKEPKKNIAKKKVTKEKARIEKVDKNVNADKKEGNENSREKLDGLLFINNEDIIYQRIPGIIIKSKKSNKDENFVNITEENKKEKDASDENGFFNRLSKESGSTIATVILVILILVILILYRARYRGSHKRVVRTISKK